MRGLLGSGHGHGHGQHYRHDGQDHQRHSQNHQRSASDYTSTTSTSSATTTASRFTKAIHLRRPRSDGGAAAAAAAAAQQQLGVIEEDGYRYRKSCGNARESESGSCATQKHNVLLGRRGGRLWGRSRSSS